jgi:hypothetical protein
MMFFNTPYERLRHASLTYQSLPDTLATFHTQGSLSELASLIYSIYRCEYDQVNEHASQRNSVGGLS